MEPLLADLEEKQYEDLYHVDDAPIADVRQKMLSQLGWWAVILTIAGAVTGLFIKFPDMIQTAFVVKSEVSEEIYRFPSTVYVEKMLVESGQQVSEGSPILEISAPDIAALLNEYTTAQARLNSFQQYKTLSADNEQSILELNIQKIKEDISLKKTQVGVLQKKWDSESIKLQYDTQETQRIFEANKLIYQTGGISRNDLNQLEGNYLKAQHAYTTAYQSYLSEQSALQKEISTQQLEINALEKQISKSANDLLLEAEQLLASLHSLKKRIESTFGAFDITEDHHLLLKAKRDGTVSFVFEGEKEVPSGTIVLKMIYESAPLYAYTQVNSSQIGRIKPGQQVVMKLDAYPVYEWGSVQGLVSSVSLTPDEKGLFNVSIQITDYQKLSQLVRIGMRGNCNIIFDDRTLYGYIFRKFKQVSSDLMD